MYAPFPFAAFFPMKHKLAWVAALLAVAVLASGAWRAQSTRQARQHTLQEQAQRSPAPLTLP